MKFKRLMSTALAGAMALSMCATAFAAGEDKEITDLGSQEGTQTTIESTINTATIKVTVPTTGSVVLNPYQLAYDLEGEEGDGTNTSNSQIISATQYIKSESDVKLNVSVGVTGVTSDAKNVLLSATDLKDNDTAAKPVTTKSVFLYYEMLPATAAKADGSDDVTITDPEWAAAYSKDAASQILVGTKTVNKANMITLNAATKVAGETEGTEVTLPAVAAFHLAGNSVSAPATAWAAADKVTVTVAYTFAATMGSATANS